MGCHENANLTTMGYYYMSTRLLKFKSLIIANVGKIVKQLEPMYVVRGNVNWYNLFW